MHLLALALVGVALVMLRSGQPEAPSDQPSISPLVLEADDRILVLAPHPDDETLACGGVIDQAVTANLPLRVVFLTYGDNNQWSFLLYQRRPELLPNQVRGMGLIRRAEGVAALAALGVSQDEATFLGYPDFGTLNIFFTHWGNRAPFRSMLTNATAVPYSNAFHPNAPYTGESILTDLTKVIREFAPTKVFVSHPSDRNPDHLALYLFTRVALWNLASENIHPQLFPYLIHYPGWPTGQGYFPERDLVPPARLAGRLNWYRNSLDLNATHRKLAALQEHRTQFKSNARYLLSFVTDNELFGDFPDVVLFQGPDLVPLHQQDAGHAEPPAFEALPDSERARFVGIDGRQVRLDGSVLEETLDLSGPLARGVGATIYLFGYRGDRSFSDMPKLQVRIGELAYGVYDEGNEIRRSNISYARQGNRIVVRAPLSALGNPERVFTAARTSLANVSLAATSWRVLDLTGVVHAAP
jgi:LmbE family N-acetylglucosaminyl deacetylase